MLSRRPMSTAEVMSIFHKHGYNIFFQPHGPTINKMRIKELRALPNLTDLPLLSVEVSKGVERIALLCCFFRKHTGGVSGIDNLESQKKILQRVLSWWSTLSTGNKNLLFMWDINQDFQKWNAEDYSLKKLVEMTKVLHLDYALQQLIKEYTRMVIVGREFNY